MKLKTKVSQFIYKIHKWTGLSIALFIIVIGLTGSALVFLDELKFLTDESKTVEIVGKPLSPQTLLNKISETEKGIYISILEISTSPNVAYKIYYSKNKEKFIASVNQYTGTIINHNLAHQGIMHFIYDLHISFTISPWGDIAVSIIAALLVVSSITGFWMQRKYLFRVFKVGIRSDRGTKAKFSDVHKLLGTVSLTTNLIMGGTGVFITLHVFSSDFIKNAHQHHSDKMINQYPYSIDHLIDDVHKRIDSFSLNYIEFPSDRHDELVFTGSVPFGNILYKPNYSTSSVSYRISNGTWITTNDIRTSELSRKSSVFFHELHYGKYSGWPVKIIYFLSGLFPLVLALTGAIVWKKKINQNNSLLL
jgi:uncharacterized iron-regulated membrane protein